MIAEVMMPKLRFKEFHESWSKTSIAKVSGGGSYGMNAAAITYDGTHKYLRITDIDEASRSFMPSPLSSPSGEISEDYRLKPGDIVFTRTGASVGKSYLYKQNDGNLYFAGFLIKFHIDKADPNFIFATTLLDAYRDFVAINSIRSGQPGLNADELSCYEFFAPAPKEQTKIANFLTAVDTKISQLTKKHGLLTLYKKGVMQKIFNQELRFKDDDGREFAEWVAVELQTICEINPKTGLLPETFVYIDLESVEKGILLKQTVISKNDAPSRAQRVLKKEDVLFQMVRPYQGNNLFFNKTGDFVASTGSAQIRALEDPRFLYQYLHLESFTAEVMNRCTGTSYPAINSGDLGSIEISLPSQPEQTKIANFLTAIDDKITNVKSQLEAAKEYKQGLLQQMFV